jgi:hypothetical protein
MIGAITAVFVFTWIAFSAPGGYHDRVFDAVVGWVVLSLIWLVWLMLSIERWLRVPKLTCFSFSVFPAFVLFIGLALWLQAPLRLGFAVNRSAMDGAAHDVLSGKRDPSKIRRIGIYPVSSAWKNGIGQFAFIVKGTEDPSEAYMGEGFIYSETPPDRFDSKNSEHLSGHWYRYHEQCCGA